MQAKARRDALDEAIIALAGEPPFADIVGRLCCLRGIGPLTALALTVEIRLDAVPAAVAGAVSRTDAERRLDR